MNIILAVDESKVIHYKAVLGSIKTIFSDFMTELSSILGDELCTFYMDNAPIHRKSDNFAGVRNNHIIRRFDAAYSPELNPVEGCYSVIKHFIKRELNKRKPADDYKIAIEEGKSMTAIRENILLGLVEPSLELLTIDKLRGFYRYVDE